LAEHAHSTLTSDVLLPATPFPTRNNLKSQMTPVPRFAHPAESDIATWLNHNHVPWQYEPTSFPLSVDGDGHLLRSFTPDFYLPDDHTYIEMTTMRQALVTRKNQKFRQMREQYPETSVRLLYRKDVELIQAWYLKPLTDRITPSERPFITEAQVERWAGECARQLVHQLAGTQIRLLAMPSGLRFAQMIAVHVRSLTEIAIAIDIPNAKADRTSNPPTAIVTGIIGTGLSVRGVHRLHRCPVITLLDRPTARMIDMPAWFAGASVGAEWYVGAGLGDLQSPNIHIAHHSA